MAGWHFRILIALLFQYICLRTQERARGVEYSRKHRQPSTVKNFVERCADLHEAHVKKYGQVSGEYTVSVLKRLAKLNVFKPCVQRVFDAAKDVRLIIPNSSELELFQLEIAAKEVF